VTQQSSGRDSSDDLVGTGPSGRRAALADDLRLAQRLADAADEITMDRYHAADLLVQSKPDMSPVTDADRAVEDRLRGILVEHRPNDGVLGEERGGSTEVSRSWVIDPIDGTKNFVRGVPVWATLIGLLVDGEPVVGVVSAPALARRWWAAQGSGAWVREPGRDERRCTVSAVRELAEASISYASLGGWAQSGRLDAFTSVLEEAWRTRAYGDFWSYMLLAEGAVDACAEPELEIYDMTAPAAIVLEAGGRFTSLDGRPGPHGGNALATNGHLHQQLLGRLSAAGDDGER
jgi:histidinol-phosphatase